MSTMSDTSPIPPLFQGFSALNAVSPRVQFSGVIGGSGTPVLLLHGYPQTHAAWHAVAPALAAHHTVVVPDLPGYGASTLLDAESAWSKRDVAGELVAMMAGLGFERFAVIGHDRGARVGYRLCLDHPARVTGYGALAVVPTLDVWPAVDREFAKSSFHWFLFLQPDHLVEPLLAADPDLFLDTTLTAMAGSLDALHPAALVDYRNAFRRPTVRAAMIEDYRAAYGVDVDHDAADRAVGRKLDCPVLTLWAHERLVAEGDVDKTLTAVDVWRRWADDVSGGVVPGGHLIPEHAATHVVQAALPFLEGCERRRTR